MLITLTTTTKRPENRPDAAGVSGGYVIGAFFIVGRV